jgi:hypothetical protein
MSALVEAIKNPDGNTWAYTFHCPACQFSHMFPVLPWRQQRYVPYDQRKEPKDAKENTFIEEDGPVWSFNGNMESPTFRPRFWYKDKPSCHSVVTDGIIAFTPDCDHDLRGQSVPMSPCE